MRRPRLPLSHAVALSDPLAALRALSWMPHPFLLHSSLTSDRSRWSFFGADPFVIHRGTDHAEVVERWRALSARVREDDAVPTLIPFTGGAVGYWSYDFGRRLERLPAHARDDLGLPDFVIAFYDVVGAYDHQSREAWLYSSGLPFEGERRRPHAERRLDKFLWMLSSSHLHLPGPGTGDSVAARSTFRPDEYRGAVETIQEHIRRGDIFQANLSQRWTLELDHDDLTARALALHEALSACSPAPFSAYLGAGDHTIVSASPERFLELRGRRVETRPIKGTRPRGADRAEDAALRTELLESGKDRAENVMIVDVLRNDLGRVCETGSVETVALCELEVFPQVFHLTSTVAGRLSSGLDAFDLLEACFPGGSITGAPKIRAMEILDAIEPVRRHVYTGCIGYLDWRGDADWNVAIRTALVTPDRIHFAAGGGITADSDPDAEYLETLHKAEGMREGISRALGPVTLETRLEPRPVPA
jgi:para-aminobenzoate synthetase component 1